MNTAVEKFTFDGDPGLCILEVDPSVVIQNRIVVGKNCRRLKIGFGSVLGRDIYIGAETLTIGEYTTIHHGSVIQGASVSIGDNCWIGHYTIIDGTGNCKIGNGVGVGAHSQLWSHMRFGDVLEGCRFNSSSALVIEDDVWLVGHSIVGPIKAESKSMLLTGSVATRNMKENSIYRGNPASIVEKLGSQYKCRSSEQRLETLKSFIENFLGENQDIDRECYRVCLSAKEFNEETALKGITQFSVLERRYMPCRSPNEIKLMRYLLYDKAKFRPFAAS